MIRPSRGATLRVADWAREFEPEIISGSVYAVHPSQRLEAARALSHGGHRVHADIIISASGEHTGVGPEEVLLIRMAVPDARLDVHLILPKTNLTEGVRRSAEAAIQTAKNVQAETLAVSPHALQIFSHILSDRHDHRMEIWTEVAVGSDTTSIDDVDGALVMLIESGTRDSADRTQLCKIPTFSGAGRVGIDGGVTPAVAAEARRAGVSVIVSGRALFEQIRERKATHVD